MIVVPPVVFRPVRVVPEVAVGVLPVMPERRARGVGVRVAQRLAVRDGARCSGRVAGAVVDRIEVVALVGGLGGGAVKEGSPRPGGGAVVGRVVPQEAELPADVLRGREAQGRVG